MCIVCKKRYPQHILIRLQCKENRLIFFSGSGRSFYVCKECVKNKKFSKNISYLCKISKENAKSQIEQLLKEYT